MRPTRAESAARKLLDTAGVSAPPVDVEALVSEQLGIEVSYRGMDEVSGVIYRRDGGRAVMIINRNHNPERRRFSIAHEAGHYQLHEGKQTIVDPTVRMNSRDRDSSLGSDREEIEANAFAAELLMPRDIVLETIRQLGSGLTTPQLEQTLARRFKVSVAAMTYRLINLGITEPEP